MWEKVKSNPKLKKSIAAIGVSVSVAALTYFGVTVSPELKAVLDTVMLAFIGAF